jgi:hypothetical protein
MSAIPRDLQHIFVYGSTNPKRSLSCDVILAVLGGRGSDSLVKAALPVTLFATDAASSKSFLLPDPDEDSLDKQKGTDRGSVGRPNEATSTFKSSNAPSRIVTNDEYE